MRTLTRVIHTMSERQFTYTHGQAMGLDRQQVTETIEIYRDWYLRTPLPLDWQRVRRALTARAMRDEWRPWPWSN